MTVPDILDDGNIDEAANLLVAYYRRTSADLPAYTGSVFNSWAGGGDGPGVVNCVTADDLIAVSFLALDVPGEAAFGILKTHRALISDLLAQIPANLDMADMQANDFDKLLGEDSAALQLWHVLRGRDTGRWGMGETRTSKLLARKRPKLIPIYDSIVGPLMELETGSLGQWKRWHTALTDGTGLPQRLQEIRTVSGISDPISDLRVMDIVLWMHGKQKLAS
ncbi:DUF6308 family protein [Arthrobacter sp. ES3-54]|uniref:DUF6308 family protein n=1 Tax=Arthrobacter sp. ES3-54 TaxID=1502991 RepID=UPI0024052D87|nr:DUF6308 family protein [Arthrobacter sp. ES3-54]MDF9751567.1 hypothetical protein [Arthrobacter sp. ES3-54]